jgi:hypothetical protein
MVNRIRALIDLNVILDTLQVHQPHYTDFVRLLAHAETGVIEGMRILFGLLAIALFLTGCQSLFEDEPTPSPIAQVTGEATSPTPTDTGQPTPTLAADTATATSAAPTATLEVPAPVDQRIQFALGATSTTLDGGLLAGQSHSFIFGALGGQTARVEVESSDGSANFSLSGLDDGQPYKRLVNEDRAWEGILPLTQDYRLTVTTLQDTIYSLTLAIEPLAEPDLPVIMDPGSPPADRCVVVHPGGTVVVTIYLGPSTAFAPIARLGNWAEVLNGESGWYQIQIGPGQTGWVNETAVVLAGPCDQNLEPIRLEIPANGSPWRTIGNILPGQAHRYVFRAEAGKRVVIDLNSTNQVNFTLLGVDDGQPYKRVVNEDRTWEGILPLSQDYMLTVVSVDEVADYELLVGLVPAPPLTVIYDAHTGALLGGFKDELWVDASTAAGALLGGEQYGIYHLGQRLGQATGSASLDVGGICPGQTVELMPRPVQTNALAVAGADWEVALRLVAPVELSQAERQAVTNLLVGQGLAISASELQVDGALGTDLDGDGTGEIIVQASRLKDDGRFPAVDAGDYFVVAVLMEINGRLHAEPLVLQVYPRANDLAYPWRYEVSGVLDLNGDGHLEVILAGSRWEGEGTVAYSVGSAGGAIPVLERSCVE